MNRIVVLLLIVLAFPLTTNGKPTNNGGGSTPQLPAIPVVGLLRPSGQLDAPSPIASS